MPPLYHRLGRCGVDYGAGHARYNLVTARLPRLFLLDKIVQLY